LMSRATVIVDIIPFFLGYKILVEKTILSIPNIYHKGSDKLYGVNKSWHFAGVFLRAPETSWKMYSPPVVRTGSLNGGIRRLELVMTRTKNNYPIHSSFPAVRAIKKN